MKFKKPEETDLELRMRRMRDWLKQFYAHSYELAAYDSMINKVQDTIIILNDKRKEGLLDTLSFMLDKAVMRYGFVGIVIILSAGYELMEKQGK